MNPTKVKEPAHSLLGASSAARWLNCPGSFALTKDAPSAPTSIYAATGTLAHSFIEGCLTPPIASMEDSSVGSTYVVENHTIVVDQDMVDGVNTMVDYVIERVGQGASLGTELRVDLNRYFAKPPPVKLFGRLDVVLVDDNLEIVDFKNGTGVIVEPTDNPQTLYYAAGALAKMNSGKTARLPPKVTMTIVQPHARSVAKVRSSTIDVVDLLLWVDHVLVPGVHAAAADNAPLVPGVWCRFCPAAASCPKLQEDAVAMAKTEFNDAKEPLGLDEMAYLLDIATRAKVWIAAVEALALDRLKRQERIPGWSLVPTRPTRQWSDDIAAAQTLNALGVSGIFRSDLKTPAQVEKLVRKQVSTHAWEDDVSKFVKSVSSGVKLQRDNEQPFEDYPDAG